jgi:hypothetical protein
MAVGMSTGIFVTSKLALRLHWIMDLTNQFITPPTHVTMDDTLYFKEEGPLRHSCSFFPAGLLPLVMIGHGIGIGGLISKNTRRVFGHPK